MDGSRQFVNNGPASCAGSSVVRVPPGAALRPGRVKAETLRKSDYFPTSFTRWFRRLMIGAGLVAVLAGAPQPDSGSEMQLEAAIHREIVLGDLNGAMDQYRALVSGTSVSKPVSARALLHMGQCLERMGRRIEARASYLRVVNEYGDQPPAAVAGERLANWEIAVSGPRNIKFEQGVPGKVPPGWFVAVALPKDADYYAQLQREGCRSRSGCALVLLPANALSPFSNLMQAFNASAYRGKTVRLRAWLRLEAADPDDRARMWLSVDRAGRQTGFFDDMKDRPVNSAQWTRSEIIGKVDEDATFINFGVVSAGRGRVWVDDVSFETVK